MPDNKDSAFYQANMAPKANGGSASAQGDGSMANVPVVNKDPHAGEESLGDAARRIKEQKAKPAAPAPTTTPAPAKPAPKPADTKPKPSYKHGTDYVPDTGPAVLHKGEAVLNRHDADKMRSAKHAVFGSVASHLSGEHEPKKELKEVRTRKAKNGGYIHEHHHTHPETHPMEEHMSPDQDSMVSHMMDHMGEPNPGEAEADAGQSGIGAPAPTAQPAPLPGV